MLFSAPLEVARTNACTLRAEVDERLGQVRAHEAVGAGHEHRPALVDRAVVALQLLERGSGPEVVVSFGMPRKLLSS